MSKTKFDDMRYTLVEMGAENLSAIEAAEKAKDYEKEGYHRLKQETLREVAKRIFDMDCVQFHKSCHFEMTCLRVDAQARGVMGA